MANDEKKPEKKQGLYVDVSFTDLVRDTRSLEQKPVVSPSDVLLKYPTDKTKCIPISIPEYSNMSYGEILSELKTIEKRRSTIEYTRGMPRVHEMIQGPTEQEAQKTKPSRSEETRKKTAETRAEEPTRQKTVEVKPEEQKKPAVQEKQALTKAVEQEAPLQQKQSAQEQKPKSSLRLLIEHTEAEMEEDRKRGVYPEKRDEEPKTFAWPVPQQTPAQQPQQKEIQKPAVSEKPKEPVSQKPVEKTAKPETKEKKGGGIFGALGGLFGKKEQPPKPRQEPKQPEAKKPAPKPEPKQPEPKKPEQKSEMKKPEQKNQEPPEPPPKPLVLPPKPKQEQPELPKPQSIPQQQKKEQKPEPKKQDSFEPPPKEGKQQPKQKSVLERIEETKKHIREIGPKDEPKPERSDLEELETLGKYRKEHPESSGDPLDRLREYRKKRQEEWKGKDK